MHKYSVYCFETLKRELVIAQQVTVCARRLRAVAQVPRFVRSAHCLLSSCVPSHKQLPLKSIFKRRYNVLFKVEAGVSELLTI